MQIDFSSLLEPIQKTRGQVGTAGTASIHAGLARPQTLIPRGDKRGQMRCLDDGERQPIPALYPTSPNAATVRGQEKASVHAPFPVAPVVPASKGMNDAERYALAAKIRQFRFDLIEQEIADEYPAAELHRLNNLCWDFMEVDGLPFDQAMRLAAEIVVACEVAKCGRSHSDVQVLWKRIKGAV